jgi:PAS domain S-box-containing protein
MATEEPSSLLLEYTQDKVAVIDESGEFVYCNAAAERILGYDPRELIGEDAFEFVHPDDAEAVRELFGEVIASEEPTTETVRYRYRTADGSYVWFESRLSNATDDAVGGYVVSSRDISEQVAEQRRREETESRLAELSRSVCDVLWMFDADWEELLFVNRAYEEVYGGDVDRLRADPSTFLENVHPEDRDRVQESMARLSAGESTDVEYRVGAGDNYDTWVWVQGTPIVEDGEVVRIVGFTRDVTDRRRRERQLAVMDNLLRHNLRNDVSIILGNASLIASEADEPHSERAEVIREVGEELIETAAKERDIIDLITDDDAPTTVDVADLAADAVQRARERFPAATIEVDGPSSAPARGLAELTQALVELVDNAVRHAEDDAPTVRVSVETVGDRMLVRVDDDCPPIPDAEYRVLTGDREMTDVYHTTGLGLWLVHWTVELSEGRVSFERRDEGNRVTVSLAAE